MGGSGSTLRTRQNRVIVNVDDVLLADTFRTGHATHVGMAEEAHDAMVVREQLVALVKA